MSSTEEETNLEEMTKAELQDHAENLGVDWSESDTKAELIDAITAAEGGETTADDGSEEEQAYAGSPDAVPSEQFPERRPIEVDVADIEPAEYEGEIQAPLNAESWVVLDGKSDQVPDELNGKVAAVVESPVSVEHDPDTGVTKTFLSPEGFYTVKERGQGILLSVTADAFKSVHTHGRPDQFA